MAEWKTTCAAVAAKVLSDAAAREGFTLDDVKKRMCASAHVSLVETAKYWKKVREKDRRNFEWFLKRLDAEARFLRRIRFRLLCDSPLSCARNQV